MEKGRARCHQLTYTVSSLLFLGRSASQTSPFQNDADRIFETKVHHLGIELIGFRRRGENFKMADDLQKCHLDFDGGEATTDAVPLTDTKRHEVDRVAG